MAGQINYGSDEPIVELAASSDQTTFTASDVAESRAVTTVEGVAMWEVAYLSPTGIPSAESFGNATINVATVVVSPTGISSAEAFGNATITSGGVVVSPAGIASAEAFGTATITATITVSPTGIASEEAFGTAALTGNLVIEVIGIPSEEAFGTATLTYDQTLEVTGISSGEAFGTPTVTRMPLVFPVLPGVNCGVGSRPVGTGDARSEIRARGKSGSLGNPSQTGTASSGSGVRRVGQSRGCPPENCA